MTASINALSRSAMLAAAALCAAGSAASADVFTFTYTDTNGVNATGNLVANWNGSTYDAVAGDITITAGPPSVVLGYFTLVPGAGSTGAFYWDSILQPGPSTLTGAGLEFVNGGGIETNIWGNGGANNYSLYQAPPNWFYQGDAIGTFIISPAVPAPAAATVLGAGLLASSRRRRA